MFQAELYAILQCAKLDGILCRHNASIAICSDSQAALKALTSVKVTSGLVTEVIEALQHLSSFNSVRLVWAPGHCGIMGNEKANFLAKQASQTPFTGPEPVLGLSLTTVRDAVKKWSTRQQ